MKRRISTVVAAGLVLAASPAAAQRAGGSLELGLKGGATFSTISVEDPAGSEIDRLTAFGGGGFLSIPLGGVFLQPEILWTRKGAEVSGGDLGDVDVELRLDYLEVPVLLVVPIGRAVGASPYIFGGGAVAFETDCTFQAETEIGELEVDCSNSDEDVDLELQRKTTDFSAVFGGGLRIPTGSGALLIEGRYTLGLTNLNDTNDVDDDFRNRSIGAYIGYSFEVGGGRR